MPPGFSSNTRVFAALGAVASMIRTRRLRDRNRRPRTDWEDPDQVDRPLSSSRSGGAGPRGMKRMSGISRAFAARGVLGVGNEVGFPLVLRARSVVGPGTLPAPRIVATGACAPEHG